MAPKENNIIECRIYEIMKIAYGSSSLIVETPRCPGTSDGNLMVFRMETTKLLLVHYDYYKQLWSLCWISADLIQLINRYLKMVQNTEINLPQLYLFSKVSLSNELYFIEPHLQYKLLGAPKGLIISRSSLYPFTTLILWSINQNFKSLLLLGKIKTCLWGLRSKTTE